MIADQPTGWSLLPARKTECSGSSVVVVQMLTETRVFVRAALFGR